MGKESKYFGAPFFSPREIALLRYQHLKQVWQERYLRWRYRDRIHWGARNRIDAGTLTLAGLGTVELGDDVIFERGARQVVFNLAAGSRVIMGNGTWIRLFDDNMVFSTKPDAEIRIGEQGWFSGGIFGASERITIGSHTHIGFGCLVLDSNLHRMDNDAPPVVCAPVEIGSHVWMPSYITVLQGVHIGDHCVIGTGSLVTQDIPPNSFAAGRPAKIIRKIGNRNQVI